MEAVIASFRRGRHTQTNNQMILKIEGLNKKKAESMLGKIVVWKSPAGKEIKGKISNLHGNSGALRAIFERGMPGQSLGTKAEVK